MILAKDNTRFIEKLQKIVKIEKKRFQIKGLKNTIIGTILLFLLFWAGWKGSQLLWPSTIENPNSFVAWNSIIIHTAFQVVIAALSLPGYLDWVGAYKQYQVNKRSAWPWQRQNWPQVRTKTFWNLFVNELVIYPIPSYLSSVIGIDLRFDGFPSFWQVFLQTNLIFFMQDFFFYWGHRWAHEIKMFYKLHKVHHQYDHLFSPASEYHHPLDYIFFNIMPSAIVFLILGNKVHCFTFFFWIVHKILFSGENHCGYAVNWSPMRVLPLVAEVEYHDNHHSLNVGNYAGSWYIWDVLFGTAGPYLDEFLAEEKGKPSDKGKQVKQS